MIRLLVLSVALSACGPARTAPPLERCAPAPASTHPKAARWRATLDALAVETRVSGLSVAVVDGDGLWAGTAGMADPTFDVPFEPCMPSPIFSVTKTVMTAATLSLVEAGALSLDDRVETQLSAEALRGLANADRLTVRDLIGQTSGLPDYVDTTQVLRAFDQPAQRWTNAQALDLVRGRPPLFAPGARFSYSNSNWLVLAQVLEASTGQGHDVVLRERVLERLGASRARYRPDDFDHTGIVRGLFDATGTDRFVDVTETLGRAQVGPDGGLVSDASSLATLFHGLLVERRLLSAGTHGLMETFRPTSEDVERGGWASLPGRVGYGLGLIEWTTDRFRAVGHSGDGFGYQAHAYSVPAARATVVLLANSSTPSLVPGNASWRIDRAMERLVAEVANP
ncbi:MAG: beta-lactamase family protein [Myxococcaceae bacterium]|jgi:D-alanyl-D-alanine carboxypeptidase|nr:beta-lactamase family protein [Myxococcaceae bacterium]